MHEKSLILIDGPPGSGSTRLSRSLTERLREEKVSIEHISTGDRLRAIGKGALDSAYTQAVVEHFNNSGPNVAMDDSLMVAIVDEAFVYYQKKQIIILNGFPRYEPQVDDLVALSDTHDRLIRGAIITQADWQIYLERMQSRGQKHSDRKIDRDTAIDRLADRTTSLPGVIEALESQEVPVRYIDTDGPKSLTDQIGLRVLRSFYRTNDLEQTKNAS
jgi:adenylate kinase